MSLGISPMTRHSGTFASKAMGQNTPRCSMELAPCRLVSVGMGHTPRCRDDDCSVPPYAFPHGRPLPVCLHSRPHNVHTRASGRFAASSVLTTWWHSSSTAMGFGSSLAAEQPVCGVSQLAGLRNAGRATKHCSRQSPQAIGRVALSGVPTEVLTRTNYYVYVHVHINAVQIGSLRLGIA